MAVLCCLASRETWDWSLQLFLIRDDSVRRRITRITRLHKSFKSLTICSSCSSSLYASNLSFSSSSPIVNRYETMASRYFCYRCHIAYVVNGTVSASFQDICSPVRCCDKQPLCCYRKTLEKWQTKPDFSISRDRLLSTANTSVGTSTMHQFGSLLWQTTPSSRGEDIVNMIVKQQTFVDL